MPASVYQSQARGWSISPLTIRPLPTTELVNVRGRPARKRWGRSRHGSVYATDSDTLSLPTAYSRWGHCNTEPFFVDEWAQYFDNKLHYELHGDRLDVTTFVAALALGPIPSMTLVSKGMLNDFVAPQVYLADATDQNWR